MADKKITELNLHTLLTLSDVIPIVNSGETKKTTYGTLYYGIRDGVVSGSSQIILGDTNGFTSYSSSVDSKIYNLTSVTSSYATIPQLFGEVSAINTKITSLNSFTSSQEITNANVNDDINILYDTKLNISSFNDFTSSYFIDSSSFDTRIDSLTFNQLADVQDYTASEIPNGYLPVWNSGSQEWRPGRPDFEKGKTRLFVAAARSNTASFFFNSQTRTSDTSASPAPDSAFMLVSGDLDTIIVHLRSDTSVNVTIDIFKNADGVAFSSATSTVTPVTRTLTANTITSTTFSGVTINQFDSIHIKVTPTGGGNFYGIVEII